MKTKQRIYLLSLLALLCSFVSFGQETTMSWEFKSDKVSDDTYRLTATATIEEGWYLYDLGPYDGGPTATSFVFTLSEGAELVGGVKSIEQPTKYYDDIFLMELGYYRNEVNFVQDVKLSSDGAKVGVLIEWMTCSDENCTPPMESEHEFILGDSDGVVAGEDKVQGEILDAVTANAGGSIWALIIEAILWGFVALLTPCVFPMIPMTMSFFMKGDGGVKRGRFRASMYGFFIVLLYTLPIAAIIIITRVMGGDAITADIFNWLATHWIPNVLFFLVFMVFAASFFGAFEITMPSKWVNKSDKQSDKKGLGGIFFLALTLVLVSFSCTGPIVGTVIIKSTAGEFWQPIITMLAFSIAFALPFTLFAFFPSLLKNMPKSGGWLNSVKVVLGFLEVALGLKFLSIADQTYHWGLLDREVYLAIWIVVFTLLGFYLLGKLKFAHDSEVKYISVPRLALSIIVFSFVIYMIPGMWGAPLKALSGYLPPLTSQDFVLQPGGSNVVSVSQNSDYANAKYSDFLRLPHGFQGFFDYQEGVDYAERVDKPMFVALTGHGCVNCREMEQKVWSDPQVKKIMNDDYVIVSLYADDKKVLDEKDWIYTPEGRTLKSIGKINSYFALKQYGVNAQPYYVIQDYTGKQLVAPHGYNLNVQEFVDFLNGGVEAYKKENK